MSRDEIPLHREAYYFEERSKTGYIDRVPNLIALMEMFCSANHGTTVGFEERDGRIEPALAVATNAPAMAWGLPMLQEAVTTFAEHLLLDTGYLDPYADVREPLTAVLIEFFRRPTRQEAEAWGSFPWEDGLGADTVRNRFAAPYRGRDLVKTIRLGSVRAHHRAAWIDGSLVLLPRPLRAALRTGAILGRRRRALENKNTR